MKPQTPKKLFVFTATAILSVYILVFYAGCQKETSADTTVAEKANTVSGSVIIYTDINPDKSLICTPAAIQPHVNGCSTVYSLDLNNDGITDFSITYSFNKMALGTQGQSNTTTTVSISCNNLNEVAADPIYPLAMNTNDIISSGLNWVNSTALTLRYIHTVCGYGCATSYSGNWFSATDKMVGLQLKKAGKIFYGWALLAGNATVMRGYAYNSLSNQSILTGQTQ